MSAARRVASVDATPKRCQGNAARALDILEERHGPLAPADPVSTVVVRRHRRWHGTPSVGSVDGHLALACRCGAVSVQGSEWIRG